MTDNAHNTLCWYIAYVRCNVMHLLYETSTVRMLCDFCFTMPILIRLLLEWQQCQQSVSVVCVRLPHGGDPAHTDTAMCSGGLTQRWEQLSERAPVVVKANGNGTQNHMFWYVFCIHSQQHHRTIFRQASRWHCNIKAEASVLILLYEGSRKIHHHYEKCQPHVSSQIGEQIGGNESCMLIGDDNIRKCRMSG